MSGILTKTQLEASLRVLRALRTPVCASVVLAWPDSDTLAYVCLARSGYAEALETPAPRKAAATFRWDRIRATPAGLRYLEQIEAGA